MTEQVQGGIVNQETGEHDLGSGFADEVDTAYNNEHTHFTHTGALQTTKESEDNGITISKRPDEEAFLVDFDDEEYGQILATSEQVYEYLNGSINNLKQWENIVSLHRSLYSRDSFRRQSQRNIENYPVHFFKKYGVWYKTVTQNVEGEGNSTLTAKIIMWKYIPEKDVFEKVAGDRIGSDQDLFQNRHFILALGQSTRQQAQLDTYVNILHREETFYNKEKLLDIKEFAQLKLRDAELTASEAAKGNVFSRSLGLFVTAAAGAIASVLPSAPVAAASSAAPVAAFSAAGTAAAAAASAAAGTSAASAAPLTFTGAAAAVASAAAAAPLATAAAAASAFVGVAGVAASQFGQSTANAAVKRATTELEDARRGVETSRAAAAAQPPAQVVQGQTQADQNAKTLINGLTESNARRQTFANVAQKHRILHQGRTPNSANQTKRTLKRSLKSKSKRKPKSKCKKYQSRSRKTGHCRNKSRSRSPCKSGKTRKGTGRCHKSKA